MANLLLGLMVMVRVFLIVCKFAKYTMAAIFFTHLGTQIISVQDLIDQTI